MVTGRLAAAVSRRALHPVDGAHLVDLPAVALPVAVSLPPVAVSLPPVVVGFHPVAALPVAVSLLAVVGVHPVAALLAAVSLLVVGVHPVAALLVAVSLLVVGGHRVVVRPPVLLPVLVGVYPAGLPRAAVATVRRMARRAGSRRMAAGALLRPHTNPVRRRPARAGRASKRPKRSPSGGTQ